MPAPGERWLLPAGIEEVLPPRAWQLERLRRRLLDLFAGWGYELVMPPFIEFLDSLLTGTGSDLDLQTFKLTDQLSGRLMGVRADMTPQAARIDARSLRALHPVRLCYLGTVLRTRPEEPGGTRSPLQIGAELYGHAGIESDAEIVGLMLAMLDALGIAPVHLDLGHVGFFRALARAAALTGATEAALFDALQRKARPEIAQIVATLPEPHRSRLAALSHLHGGANLLARARQVLADAGSEVDAALQDLERLSAQLAAAAPAVELHIDLAELRGYRYQTGIVFAAYTPGHGQELARGGRYDEIGAVFGRARPATGFSADLKLLADCGHEALATPADAIYAPADPDPALVAAIAKLRAAGERVIAALPGQHGGATELGCTRRLALHDGDWCVVPLR